MRLTNATIEPRPGKRLARPASGATARSVGTSDRTDHRATDTHAVEMGRIANLLDAEGKRALQRLERSGRLDGSLRRPDQSTLLAQLSLLTRTPLATGLDRHRLMNDLIRQLADPGLIHQGNRGTCTVTTLEYRLALVDPAEYARLIVGLASPEGKVRMASGKQLERVEDSLTMDDSGRSDVSRLFEAALMDMGNGIADYRNRPDRHGLGKWTPFPTGLMSFQVARTATALTGRRHEAVEVVPIIGRLPLVDWGVSSLMRKLMHTLETQGPAPTMLDWRGEGDKTHAEHMVLVLRIEGDRVVYRNPWGNTGVPGTALSGDSSPERRLEASGGIESMSLSEFRKRLQGFVRQVN